MSERKPFLVVAIDFGTAYSGYSYQYIDQHESNKLNIGTAFWSDGRMLESAKTPTVLLMPKDLNAEDEMQNVFFGYEAENKYMELLKNGGFEKYYFCSLFKMELYKPNLSQKTTINDINGFAVNAMKVFELSISFLKQHCLDELLQSNEYLEEEDIKWMLFVPAIWDESAKEFMRKAAKKAGIHDSRIKIVLEPEVASVYCRDRRRDKTGVDLGKMAAGDNFIVVDSGGGTVDVTVHQLLANGKLNELHPPTGGAWGGATVNRAYRDFLVEIFGVNILERLQTRNPKAMLEIERVFENAKCFFKATDVRKFESFWMPSLLMKLHTAGRGPLVIPPKYEGKVRYNENNDELLIRHDVMKAFFTPAVSNIVNHLKDLMATLAPKHIEYIFMVGGFSECVLLQEAIRDEFHSIKVIIPAETQLSVLKGAVIFGHKPEVIQERVAKYTYGTDLYVKFNPKKHLYKRRVKVEGEYFCKIFNKFVTKNDRNVTGKPTKAHDFVPLRSNDSTWELNFYKTDDLNPKFVDDSAVDHIGTIKIADLPILKKRQENGRKIGVSITPGDTQLKARAFNKKTKEEHSACFDYF